MVSEVYRYRTRERIWIEENTRLVRDPRTDEPLYYDGTVREITEKVQRLDLQRRYDQIGAAVSGCLYQHRRRPDGSREMPYASPGVVELFGFTPDGVEGRLLHPRWGGSTPTIGSASPPASRIRSETLDTWQCEYRVRVPGKPERVAVVPCLPGARGRRLDAMARLPHRRDRTEARRGADLQARLFRPADRPAQPGADPRCSEGRDPPRCPPGAMERTPVHRPRPVQALE